MQLALGDSVSPVRSISPLLELGAYEALWDQPKTSFKSLAELFSASPTATPSQFIERSICLEYAERARNALHKARVDDFGIRVHRAGEYPAKLRDAKHPIELLYFRGWWDLVETRGIAVVGTRRPSHEGIARTRKLVKHLVADNFTVVSGLAAGIDRTAHLEAINNKGQTIAVVGTPITRSYPKENRPLQELIARAYLLISQVPIIRYERQGPHINRYFFPERNITMSALTEATIITEASDTSGTLIQARAALAQGRKLFILDSCFQNEAISWPNKFLDKGAIRVEDYKDIQKHLDR